MNFRLLLDIDVVEVMATLPRREQVALRRRLGEIQSLPTRFADFQEPDTTGRSLDVHVHCGFAIYYWEDLADRHIKVFSIPGQSHQNFLHCKFTNSKNQRPPEPDCERAIYRGDCFPL